jgi:hypothetical protein
MDEEERPVHDGAVLHEQEVQAESRWRLPQPLRAPALGPNETTGWTRTRLVHTRATLRSPKAPSADPRRRMESMEDVSRHRNSGAQSSVEKG